MRLSLRLTTLLAAAAPNVTVAPAAKFVPEIATAVEFMVKGALQRWLGDVLQVETLEVAAEESTLRVDITYRVLATDERRTTSLVREA